MLTSRSPRIGYSVGCHEHRPFRQLVLGHREGGDPADDVDGSIDGPSQLVGQFAHRGERWCAVEATDLHVHWVHGASTDHLHDPVAELLQSQPTFHLGAVLRRHRDAIRVAEEVGGVQEVDVQHVALDPLTAVEEIPKLAQRVVDLDAACGLERVARTHLIRDGADAADASGDVDGLGVVAADQEALEEARWLENAQPHVDQFTFVHLDDETALTFHAGERLDTESTGAMFVGHAGFLTSQRCSGEQHRRGTRGRRR